MEYAAKELESKALDEIIDINGLNNPIISMTTTLNTSQVAILTQKSPPDMIQSIPGRGGKVFDYLAHNYVTQILNEAFGHRWDFEVSVIQIIEDVESIVKGRLTVYGNNDSKIVKEQFGQQDILKGGMAMGDCLKGAGSDALRKCASLLGIGLDLYGKKRPSKPSKEESLGAKIDAKAKAKQSESKPSFRNIKWILNNCKNLIELQAFWVKHTDAIKALSDSDRNVLTELKNSLKSDLTAKTAPAPIVKLSPEYLIQTDQISRIKDIVKPGGSGHGFLLELELLKLADFANNPNALKTDADLYIGATVRLIKERESKLAEGD